MHKHIGRFPNNNYYDTKRDCVFTVSFLDLKERPCRTKVRKMRMKTLTIESVFLAKQSNLR